MLQPPGYPNVLKYILLTMYSRASTNDMKERVISMFCTKERVISMERMISMFCTNDMKERVISMFCTFELLLQQLLLAWG